MNEIWYIWLGEDDGVALHSIDLVEDGRGAEWFNWYVRKGDRKQVVSNENEERVWIMVF